MKTEIFESEIHAELAGMQWTVPIEITVLHAPADKANGVMFDETEICGIRVLDPAQQDIVDGIPAGQGLIDALMLEIWDVPRGMRKKK